MRGVDRPGIAPRRSRLIPAALLAAAVAMLPTGLVAQDAAAPPIADVAPAADPASSTATASSTAATEQPPVADPALTTPLALDRSDRITLPVHIGGVGPFAFVVDTGAERTVIARELAERLGLMPTGRARVIGIASSTFTDLYTLDALDLPSLPLSPGRVPSFSHGNIGAAGLIGIQSLEQHRVVIDFRNRRVDVRPSPRSSRAVDDEFDRDAIVVTARRTAGRMILSNAEIGGRRIDVIVDTGAQTSIGNLALRDLVQRLPRQRRGELVPDTLTDISGARIAAQRGQLRSIDVGGFDFRDLPIMFAASPAFVELGLVERPAILLGMDALQLFDRVAIDFTNRRVTFDLPDTGSVDRSRLAAAAP